MYRHLFILSSVLVVSFVVTDSRQYMTEKPTIITPCTLGDQKFRQCFADNFQVLFREWVNGVPGLKTVGTLEPLHVKRVKLTPGDNSVISLSAIVKNLVISGLSKATVKDANINRKNFDVVIKLFLPKTRFDFDIKAKGRVFSLPINGEGKAFIETENVLMSFQVKSILHTEGENVFMDIQSIKSNVDDIQKFHIHTDHLFGGQKDLEDSANALFNEQWRDLFEVLRPAVEQIVEAVLLDRFKKIFNFVPSSYFVSDLPRV